MARSASKPVWQALFRGLLPCLVLFVPFASSAQSGGQLTRPISGPPPYKCDGGIYRRDGNEV